MYEDANVSEATWEIVRVWRGPRGAQIASKVLLRVWARDGDDALETFSRARAAVGCLDPYPGELGARELSA